MQDRSGVVIPPPLIVLVGFLLGVGLQRWLGSPGWTFPGRRALGFGLATIGLGWAVAGMLTFRRHRTAINPMHPASTVVTGGPYRFTRNPMYLGLSIIYLGLALAFGQLWALVTFPLTIGFLQSHAIQREERYLAAKFGETYREYRQRVRRWL